MVFDPGTIGPQCAINGTPLPRVLVGTAGAFEQAVATPGQTIELTADIDLSGRTGGLGSLRYSRIDGKGHTIKSLSQAANGHGGLFASIHCSLVTDLVIDNVHIVVASGANYASGILAGSASDSHFERIEIRASSIDTSQSSANTGGLIGAANGDIVFDHVVSAANIRGSINSGDVGGLVGQFYVSGSRSALAIRASSVSGSLASGLDLGGLIGALAGNAGQVPLVTIIGSSFTGTLVYTPRPNAVGLKSVGGMIGMAASASVRISGATVSGTFSGTEAGGALIGHSYQPTADSVPVFERNSLPNGMPEVGLVESTLR